MIAVTSHLSRDHAGVELPNGLIFEIARDAGFELHIKNGKAAVRCRFHDDRTASAFVSESNVFYCSVCTADAGWPAKRFASALGLSWDVYTRRSAPLVVSAAASAPRASFTADDARITWVNAFGCGAGGGAADAERDVCDYLSKRGLASALVNREFGVLAERPDLHPTIASWPRRGYRIIVPLYDSGRHVVCLQARAIRDADPKTLFPTGSKVAGTVFADWRGRCVLDGNGREYDTVLLGEGLTDMLALAVASPVPVFTAPGTSNAVTAVGPWAMGRKVLLALDCDHAGTKAIGPVARALYDRGARAVRGIQWPRGSKDACDVLTRLGEDGLREFLNHQMRATAR